MKGKRRKSIVIIEIIILGVLLALILAFIYIVYRAGSVGDMVIQLTPLNRFRVFCYSCIFFLVIPVKTRIQSFQDVLDTRLRGYDG
jgi:hypothetical protein